MTQSQLQPQRLVSRQRRRRTHRCLRQSSVTAPASGRYGGRSLELIDLAAKGIVSAAKILAASSGGDSTEFTIQQPPPAAREPGVPGKTKCRLWNLESLLLGLSR